MCVNSELVKNALNKKVYIYIFRNCIFILSNLMEAKSVVPLYL